MEGRGKENEIGGGGKKGKERGRGASFKIYLLNKKPATSLSSSESDPTISSNPKIY